ncbi:thioredoxin-like domain-containing protein [Schlesneria sp.]|uniref:thioredoxin-like domain-containing protein n=1 Tax=Schlesneria sp. TaxID=2762018 RepID=UPI002F01BB3F
MSLVLSNLKPSSWTVPLGVVLCSLFLLVASATPVVAQEAKVAEPEGVENPFPRRHPSPELDGGVEWLNAAGPISVKDLRGKIVLVDFWTFCCINCIHVLPDLAYLEHKYPNELVVIGVHSAKFDNEKETGNIRKAILRYEIEHPVVNDANMTIWRKFGVNSWPSLVVLDPEGYYCGYVSGEGNRELLEEVIERLIAYHKTKGTLDETPVRFDLERNKVKDTPLRFPGKIVVDEQHGRLFISDSNHNRIVVSTLDGKLLDVIGAGAIGHKDGGYSEAQFDHPQGMVLVDQTLYVADTENHLLRTVDLERKTVSTLAGTGEQSRTRSPGGPLLQTALNSPWDLTVVDGTLYIAMAGPHQIWAHKLGSETLAQYAGSGREDIIDGSLEESALAQPSGIVNDGSFLYVVDSEGSSIRKISTNPDNDLTSPTGEVTTIAGTHDLPRGRSLFEFGDIDGAGEDARLQHPLGLAIHNGTLFVTDSYNHKIKQVNLETREVKTWTGNGQPGTTLEPLQLAEPAGIAIAGGKAYVADTNNHRIVVIEMNTRKSTEFMITGLTAPQLSDSPFALPSEPVKATEIESQDLSPTDSIAVQVELELPEGFKLNELMPVSYRLKADEGQTLFADDQLGVKQEIEAKGTSISLSLPAVRKTGTATAILSLTYGYCRDGNGGVCKVGTTHWKIPIATKEGASGKSISLKAVAK